MTAIVLDLPIPPLVNRTRRIDWSAHRLVKAWRRTADGLMLVARCRKVDPIRLAAPLDRFEVEIMLSSEHTKGDLDSVIKTTIDYLKHAGLIVDDAQKHLRRLTVGWTCSEYASEGMRVTVREVIS
ncbi:hypothetical protein CCR97_08155 [Rhodoplanes elegans]|uniref:Uncharacterized protein n=1 Tax=Rhodoplanes elegans TaxID=29408 RepID=A0A327KUS9_9BRAD|nr:hypothetical protein [Rhodoplanes elegans]MBK5958092.1 hypothetical protein [Rhodoplanes elegans]MBK5958184.1 hypothetical protein [Rhodoplanes elegans]RAI41967.1 hypothetical protein CH338_01295 [Rhodoplanes elegans]